jgi:acylphosphatase
MEANSGLARLHATVEGRVQGVGFRAFVQDRAGSLGLVGWVRNRWDGSVEVLAEGERGKLGTLLTALHSGPGSAWVSNVKASWQLASGEFQRFSVRSTE